MNRARTEFGFLLLATWLAAGCGGEHTRKDAADIDGGPSQPDRYPEPCDQAQADSAPVEDAEGWEAGQPPIVDRPAAGPYVCSVTRDRTSHVNQARFWQPALQALSNGSLFLARMQGEGPSPSTTDAPVSFLVSPFTLDGSMLAPTTIPINDARMTRALASAPHGEGFVLVWADPQGLFFAAFDAQGAMQASPKLIANVDTQNGVTLQMAADRAGNGFALALSLRNANANQPFALFLDSSGTARSPIRRLGTPPNGSSYSSYPAPTVTAASDGYAFLWNDVEGDRDRMFFAKTDALGNETVAPLLVASSKSDTLSFGPVGFARTGGRIIEAGGGFVAAWTEAHRDYVVNPYEPLENKNAWSVVRLTRLDAQGVATGISATLRAPEKDVDEVEAVLTPFHDTLAVTWGRGSHIYICGGCVPDDRIDFVLIDPLTLAPQSNVATVTNGGGSHAGGLLNKYVAVSGESLLVLYSLTFHTYTEPGSTVFTCTR